MKKIVVKYSKLSADFKKAVREKVENEDVKFFSFPYQGNMEEGFLMEGLTIDGEAVNYLVILDTEKKTKYKPTEDDDEEDDDLDELADVEEDISAVDVDDEFKDEEVDDADDVDDGFEDDEDIDDVAEEEFDDDDEK